MCAVQAYFVLCLLIYTKLELKTTKADQFLEEIKY